jgi:Flp pilus assembly protein TadB
MAHAGAVASTNDPILVTTARRSPRDERRDRERRYLITMGIRVFCFIMAIVLFGLGVHWAAGIAVAASLVLPWIAVVMANAGPSRDVEQQPQLYRRRHAAIERSADDD